MRKSTTPLLLALLMCAFASINIVHAEALPRTISVSGQGKATAPPNMATIRSGVVTQAKTAQDALSANNRAMETIMKVLKEKGIENKDIQTSGFNVTPEYPPYNRGKPQSREIKGYRVSNNVAVKVRNLSRLGEILDALVRAGSNQISGVSFGISDPSGLMNDARKRAIDDARGRAMLYAQAAGVRVGRVITISEQSIRPPQPMFQARMAMADMASSSVPIATGEQEVSANINMMFEINN